MLYVFNVGISFLPLGEKQAHLATSGRSMEVSMAAVSRFHTRRVLSSPAVRHN